MSPPPPPTAAPLPNYGLPPLPSLPCPEFRGPTPWSNWVVKGRLLAGAYPASLDDAETERILTTLLELGVNTFVCLQAEFSLHTPEAAWRAGQGLRPYIKDAQQILIRARESRSHRIKQDKLDFLHLPIIDGNVTGDSALSRLADDCCMRLLRGERMYIHCWGGHGRTGTLVAVMLGRLYSCTCAAALRFTQAFHDSRRFPQGVRSPQTAPQVAQVKRLLPDPPSVRGVAYPRDYSLTLDDTILRPSSSPPSPTKPASPTASPCAPVQMLGSRGCSPVAAGAADMEVNGEEPLPSVPLNQQRKDAIRAKQAGGSGTASSGSSGSSSPARPGSAAGVSPAVSAASLQPKEGRDAVVAAAAPMPASVAGRHMDWLQGVFDKGQGKLASALRSASGGIAAAHSKPQDAAAAGYPAPQPGRSYLHQYVQQQQQQELAGKAGNLSSGRPVISLNATSGLAGGPYADEAMQRVDLTPSKVTVAVPEPAGGAERSASSMARMLNYLSGKSTTPR